jgi:hypothetical protein
LKEEHQTMKDDCGTYFELANELEEELKELKEMSTRKIILLEKEVDAARQDAAAARQDSADTTLRLQTAQETFERELEAARQEAADATLRLQTAQETIERQASQLCAAGEPAQILEKGSLPSVNSLLLQSLEDNTWASAEDRLPEFVEDAEGSHSDAMERAEGDCDYYLLAIFGGGLRQRIAEKFRVVQERLRQGQHEELPKQEQHEAKNNKVKVAQQKLPRHTPTCRNADTSWSGRAVSSSRTISYPNKITTNCASVNSRSLHKVKAPCREHARVSTCADARSAGQHVHGVIFHKDTTCQTIFLLVQDLKLEGAPLEGDVCATVSLSQRGTGEASIGVVAMTPYKELRKQMTSWNDILMLEHLPGSVVMDLKVSVWSRTCEGDDLLLAQSTFMLNGLYDGFSDEHLDLRIDQGAHSLVEKLTLRMGASWSKGDVEMLQKGLLPSSARNSLRATGPPCKPKVKHDQVRVLDCARNIVANEQGMDLPAPSSPETGTDNDEGQMIMQAVTSWPLKGRIVVNCWAPFNIVKIDEAAQDLLGCETRLTEGRSVAACARARVDNEEGASTFDSTNILLACSHVAGCGQGHRAFLLMNDGIFVLVQHEEAADTLPRQLAVLLFRPSPQQVLSILPVLGTGYRHLEESNRLFLPPVPSADLQGKHQRSMMLLSRDARQRYALIR